MRHLRHLPPLTTWLNHAVRKHGIGMLCIASPFPLPPLFKCHIASCIKSIGVWFLSSLLYSYNLLLESARSPFLCYQYTLRLVNFVIRQSLTVLGIFQFSGSGLSVSKHTEAAETVVTASSKTCLYAQVSLKDYFPPSLKYEFFVYTIRDLPSEYDESAYLKFVDDWGTVSTSTIDK